jgi:hypothetical protein
MRQTDRGGYGQTDPWRTTQVIGIENGFRQPRSIVPSTTPAQPADAPKHKCQVAGSIVGRFSPRVSGEPGGQPAPRRDGQTTGARAQQAQVETASDPLGGCAQRRIRYRKCYTGAIKEIEQDPATGRRAATLFPQGSHFVGTQPAHHGPACFDEVQSSVPA